MCNRISSVAEETICPHILETYIIPQDFLYLHAFDQSFPGQQHGAFIDHKL